MEIHWEMQEVPDSKLVESLQAKYKVDVEIAQLMVLRGLTDEVNIKAFFYPELAQLHDPLSLLNMEAAVKKILAVKAEGGKVLLYGDYDVDGTTSVALMSEVLSKLEIDFTFYIPDRHKEGYGISLKGVDFAKSEGCALLISLDCGIRALDEIAYANSLGVEVLVCDHHEQGERLPDAIVLNPKQEGCSYPNKGLSGCGVAYKLGCTLLEALQTEDREEFLIGLLDFVAISIACDMVSVLGENRILATHGLKKINSKPRYFLEKLIGEKIYSKNIQLEDLAFRVGPKINAAGRMQSAALAVELMSVKTQERVDALIAEIEALNLQRKEMDSRCYEEAVSYIESHSEILEKPILVVSSREWHQGVLGIVAARIMETYKKPTIVLSQNEDNLLTGSARSFGTLDIHLAIEASKAHLVKYGGHTFAAGLSLHADNFEAFQKTLFEEASKQHIGPNSKTQMADLEIAFSSFIPRQRGQHSRLLKFLDALEPFGPDNPKPVFCSRGVYCTDSRILKGAHLKLRVTQQNVHVNVDAIGFHLSNKEAHCTDGIPLKIYYHLEINEFRGERRLQLALKDVQEDDSI